MGRYKYAGPFDFLQFDDKGTLKEVNRDQEIEITDDAFAQDQTRRGFHLFLPVGQQAPAETVTAAESAAVEPAAAEEPATPEEEPK